MNEEIKNMTIAEMLAHPYFKKEVKKTVNELEKLCWKHYGNMRSQPALTLYKQNKLTVNFIMNEIPNVINKVSSEPSAVRGLINEISRDAAEKVLVALQREHNLKLAEEVRKKRKEAKENVQAIPGK